MKTLRDLHVHSNFCDGDSAPEEIVLSAIGRGLGCLGICTHSYVDFDPGYCLPPERYAEFRAEIARLREKYRDKIELLCGIEQDFCSETDTAGFDYVIGSVHYLKVGDEFLPVDNSPQIFEDGCRRLFGGDHYALARQYYDTVSRVVEKTGCDIIGHFDLLTKFNSGNVLFDDREPGYVRAYRAAADKLIPYGIPFEINTGAVSRGYRKEPYPAEPIIRYIKEKGGKFVLSSDSHRSDTVAYMFEDLEDRYAAYLFS